MILFQMSKATKRKHVLLEVLQDDYSPPNENQQIVRIVNNRGNNLHEVEAMDKSTFLVSMPTKFRRNLWVKRGDFVLVEPIVEGDKVKAEIARILSTDHIKYLKRQGDWPKEFDVGKEHMKDSVEGDLKTEVKNKLCANVSDTDSSSEASS